MQNSYKKIFLASNSAEGFVSYFKDAYNIRDGWHVYIIKGGSGCGKSTFMYKVAQKAGQKGFDPVLCYCSSDPNSLDGVIIEEKKIFLLDGTPPHTVEPEIYGVCEQIINLGEFLSCEMLRENAENIIALKDKNAFHHKTASRYISVAGQLYFDNLKLARQSINYKKIKLFAEKLSKKFIQSKYNRKSSEKCYFLSGITPCGVISFADTLECLADKFVIIEDKYGAAASIIIQSVINAALLSGYDVTVFKNPLYPSEITDCVVINELSLCFACENGYLNFDNKIRKIHSSRFYDLKHLKKHKNKIFFNRRVAKELISCGVTSLKQAKAVHDSIEDYYKSAADFEKINQKTDDFIKYELHL